MPRKLPLYLSDLQSLTAAAILPRALRRTARRRALAGTPALTPNQTTVLCGLHVLATVNRGGIRARELHAAELVSPTRLAYALTDLVELGLITRSRRVKVELMLYTVTPKGADVIRDLYADIQREARAMWHILASGVVRSKPTDKRIKYRAARRKPTPPPPTPPAAQ